MDWQECCNKRIVKTIEPDRELITSLMKISENKLQSEEKLILDTVTATAKVSLAYDALREVLEAVALTNGYKIYNHECYAAFLKEVICKSDKGDEFNELRKVRNNINYYGKEIMPEEAKGVIQRMKNLRLSMLEWINNQKN